MKYLGRLLSAFHLFRRRGLSYGVYIFSDVLYQKFCYQLFRRISPRRLWRAAQLLFALLITIGAVIIGFVHSFLAALFSFIVTISAAGFVILTYRQWNLHRMIRLARSIPEPGRDAFTHWDQLPVEPQVRIAVERYRREHSDNTETILGTVDNDGRLKGEFGPLPGWVMVDDESFQPRYQNPLHVVLKDGLVLLKKNFESNRKSFAQEWLTAKLLQGKANIPSVYCADESHGILYKNLVVGRTVRDVLVESGADILTHRTILDTGLDVLSGEERLNAILDRGKQHLSCLPEAFLQEFERQLEAIHREGITGVSLTFGNVMMGYDQKPWLIDFGDTHRHGSTKSPLYAWYRNKDRKKFNRIYNRSLLTEESARDELKKATGSKGWYAPVDFGGGLTVGGFWSVDTGSGKWDYFNSEVMTPLLQGKRILDLGSNNGVMPLLMLRAGAREVVGLEFSKNFVDQAQVVKRVFEWRDMRSYNLTLHHADMREILDKDFGEFDVVTSLCTLYYLTEEDMAKVVHRASEIAPMMIVQANEVTRKSAAENKAEKSSVGFLRRLLLENGFTDVPLHERRGFSRPILVGRVGRAPALRQAMHSKEAANVPLSVK